MKKLSKQVKMFRVKKKWSQQWLAYEASLSITTLLKIEQNKSLEPKIQTIWKLADAFDITIDELVGR